MTHWAVKLNRGRRTVHVYADYHVIEAGVLKFRNSVRFCASGASKNGGYPISVQAFAAGEWAVVTNLDVEHTP